MGYKVDLRDGGFIVVAYASMAYAYVLYNMHVVGYIHADDIGYVIAKEELAWPTQ